MSSKPALQVIILGSGGGPKEDNTTGLLVRSTATQWKRGSVLAVDAGTHLAAITRIIEPYVADTDVANQPLTSGPFEGLKLPCVSVEANAAHITRFLIDAFLITHPHLDHISGFVINTAGLPASRPKRVAGLPSTIAAFKDHIFNNVIWPNLSDENNGVGLVTYMRLVDGGSPALGGDGDDKGYVEICEGLSVKALSVSHGHCMEYHSHRGSGAGSLSYEYDRRSSNSTPVNAGRPAQSPEGHKRQDIKERICVYDSSAYFIRDIATGRQVLIFGDVEPDAVSLSPRNLHVWTDAAPKIASGVLATIFIECSYSNSQSDDQLYGHLVPRFLIEELKTLATCVEAVRQNDAEKKSPKRKRISNLKEGEESTGPRRSTRISATSSSATEVRRSRRTQIDSGSTLTRRSDKHRPPDPDTALDEPLSPRTTLTLHQGLPDRLLPLTQSSRTPEDGPTTDAVHATMQDQKYPLKGLKVIIIHVKETLEDTEPAGETILRQIREYEEQEKLGCEFILPRVGMSFYV